jgi:hypothetical protein
MADCKDFSGSARPTGGAECSDFVADSRCSLGAAPPERHNEPHRLSNAAAPPQVDQHL